MLVSAISGNSRSGFILSEYTYEGMFLLDSNRFAADAEGTQGAVRAIV